MSRWYAVSGLALALVLACGPSVQSIYEGNVRFEHCYRLDLDPAIAPTHRNTCWHEWKADYTYGQSRDRVDYADRRIRALAAGDYSRTSLDLTAPSSQAAADVPAPTSVNAPPPAIAASPAPVADAGPAMGAAPSASVPPPPSADCEGECRDKRQECLGPCPAGGSEAGKAKPANSCKACEPDYKKCMRRCFK